MEPKSNNYVHIISEAVIVGGISMYFFKKINDLETTVEDLKSQVIMQNNQLRYLLGSNAAGLNPNNPIVTPLNQPQKENFNQPTTNHINQIRRNEQTSTFEHIQLPPSDFTHTQRSTLEHDSIPPQMDCEGGVCRLVPKGSKENKNLDKLFEKQHLEKVVSISKISKQIEFDRENMDLDQSSKVNTFTNFSPNPVLKSVTPKPSISASEGEMNPLEKILNDIDDE